MMIQTFNERMIWEEFPQVFFSLSLFLSPPWSDETRNRRQQLRQPVDRKPFTYFLCWRQFFVTLITGRKWPEKKLNPACVWLRGWFAVFLQALWFLGEVSFHCASSAWLLWPPWWTPPSLLRVRNASPCQSETLEWMNLRSAEGLVQMKGAGSSLLGSEESAAGPCWRNWGGQCMGRAGMIGGSAGLPLCPGSANSVGQSGWLMGWAVCAFIVGVLHLIVFWGLFCSGAVMSLRGGYC